MPVPSSMTIASAYPGSMHNGPRNVGNIGEPGNDAMTMYGTRAGTALVSLSTVTASSEPAAVAVSRRPNRWNVALVRPPGVVPVTVTAPPAAVDVTDVCA